MKKTVKTHRKDFEILLNKRDSGESVRFHDWDFCFEVFSSIYVEAVFENCDLQSMTFAGPLIHVRFINCNMTNVLFTARLDHCDFTKICLEKARFDLGIVQNCSFKSANMQKCFWNVLKAHNNDFRGADLYQATGDKLKMFAESNIFGDHAESN